MAEYIDKSDVTGLVQIGWSGDAIVTAIINDGISSVPAIPIPDGATRAQVFEAVFGMGMMMAGLKNMEWWNSPYKGAEE